MVIPTNLHRVTIWQVPKTHSSTKRKVTPKPTKRGRNGALLSVTRRLRLVRKGAANRLVFSYLMRNIRSEASRSQILSA